MIVVTSNEVIDRVLDRHADALGEHATRYRNHVYRGLNYQLRILGEAEPTNLLALAWAVHDLGVWTDRTLDYLGPSARLGRELAAEFGVEDVELLSTLVECHHAIRPLRDRLAESFRVADRADASAGRWRGPLTKDDIRVVRQQFPYRGFHGVLAIAMLRYAAQHPLRPLPMLRW